MKRLSLVLAGLCLVAGMAMAQTNEVTSVNVVGYYKITIPPSNKYTLVSLNLDAIDPTNQNLSGIFGSQLRSGASPALADRIYFYNTGSGQYSTFYRKSTDGLYYNTSSGAVSNRTIASGESMWILGKTGSTTNYDVTVMGEVVAVGTQQVAMVPGFQLLGYTFSSDMSLVNSFTNGTAGASPALADRLYVWNGTSYDQYALRAVGGAKVWYSTVTGFSGPSASNTIPMGVGMWYNAKNSFTLTETNKYIGNLR